MTKPLSARRALLAFVALSRRSVALPRTVSGPAQEPEAPPSVTVPRVGSSVPVAVVADVMSSVLLP